MKAKDPVQILFVCLGNICRSPLAEGIFLYHADLRSLQDMFGVDSCGTGDWHTGEKPDRRERQIARKHGVYLPSIARQLDADSDFQRFDFFLAMDRANRADLLKLGANPERVHLMRNFDPASSNLPEEDLDVPDPYYGGDEGFEQVYTMLVAACKGLIDTLVAS